MARPKKEINWNIVEKRMEAGCPAREIAGALTINIDTFYDRFKEEFGSSFSDYSDTYHHGGDGNIRFTQYVKALSGNTNMLTILGKERLGQGKDVVTKSPFEDIIELTHENMNLRAELAHIKEQLDADKS